MALTVDMPQLGESVTQGTIAKWLKQPGDAVAKFESIAEVITDKVNAEIPSPAEGTMGEHVAAEGAVVVVGEPICTIEGAEFGDQVAKSEKKSVSVKEGGATDSASIETPPEESQPPIAATITAVEELPIELTGANSEEAGVIAETPAPTETSPKSHVLEALPPSTFTDNQNARVTPMVRVLAREQGVSLAQVKGTGIGGRITKQDVIDYVDQQGHSGQVVGVAAPIATGTSPQVATSSASAPTTTKPIPEGDQVVTLSPIRKAIADHMVRSKQTSPHAWMMVEVDMTKVARLRAAKKTEFKQHYGVNLTFLPFVARSVVEGLQHYRSLNAVWSDQGIVEKREINLGIAVALEDNLIVPVIRNADHLTVLGLAQAMGELADRARNNKLTVNEIQGGTFTLNNTGSLGTVMTQAIINQPQAAILTMDAIVKRPVVIENDAIAIRSMMNLCISFDHRINDGLQASRFLKLVKSILEGMSEATSLL